MKKWWLATPLVVALLLVNAVPSHAWSRATGTVAPRVRRLRSSPFWGYPYYPYGLSAASVYVYAPPPTSCAAVAGLRRAAGDRRPRASGH